MSICGIPPGDVVPWSDVEVRLGGKVVEVIDVVLGDRRYVQRLKHRPWSGRKRGGLYPQWKWTTMRSTPGRFPAQRLRHYGCSATVMAWPSGWLAYTTSIARLDYGFTYRPRAFARRCDAKRWCERQLANEYARSWGNDPDARVPAVYGEIVFATGEHP